MNLVTKKFNSIPSMNNSAIQKVDRLENVLLNFPQVEINTEHLIHAGMYARTIKIPANTMMSGALIKIPTIIIIDGHTLVFIGDETKELCGHHVIAGNKNRKQAFLTYKDTYITMIFPTNAKTIEDAEMEFTDEYEKLLSRNQHERKELS